MSRKRKRPNRARSRPSVSPTASASMSEENDTVSERPFLVESQFIDDKGSLLSTLQVNLHASILPSSIPWPFDVPRVVKGCRTKYAIEECGKLRLSKPDAFRFSGETLIGDESETIISRDVAVTGTRINEPEDVAIARIHDQERNRGAELIGSTQRVTTNTVTKTDRRTDKITETHGRNGWMWCTSLEPTTPEEWQLWKQSLDPSYDFITTIRSPRAFARALAVMVADQIGPQGDLNAKWTQAGLVTYHPSQWVFHGPVIYIDDPYEYVSGAADTIDRALRATFSKNKTYETQREYRFFIWAHQEPSELTIDLEVSQEMMASLASA